MPGAVAMPTQRRPSRESTSFDCECISLARRLFRAGPRFLALQIQRQNKPALDNPLPAPSRSLKVVRTRTLKRRGAPGSGCQASNVRWRLKTGSPMNYMLVSPQIRWKVSAPRIPPILRIVCSLSRRVSSPDSRDRPRTSDSGSSSYSLHIIAQRKFARFSAYSLESSSWVASILRSSRFPACDAIGSSLDHLRQRTRSPKKEQRTRRGWQPLLASLFR